MHFLGKFDTLLTSKPFLPIVFPSSGFCALYIPSTPAAINTCNKALDLINLATPFLKFIFLVLTITLTILSLILQIKKLKDK